MQRLAWWRRQRFGFSVRLVTDEFGHATNAAIQRRMVCFDPLERGAGREGRRCDDPNAALEQLCRTYWPPLYAFIRREGHDDPEAQDLTQEFFLRLVSRDFLQRLQDQRGKF